MLPLSSEYGCFNQAVVLKRTQLSLNVRSNGTRVGFAIFSDDFLAGPKPD